MLTYPDYTDVSQNLLQHHMAAVLLSPNLTAYVVDTQHHVMVIKQYFTLHCILTMIIQDFICEHPDMFKLPLIIFEDAELKTALSKIVTKVLATTRGQFKIKVSLPIHS